MTFPFKREPESGLIIVSIEIDGKYELKMVLDTGATNTTIDSNALYLLGYDLKDNIGTVEIETANGVIETEVFEIHTFFSLGLTKKNFQIQVYDFLAHGIFSDYNGLLGLDFFEGTKFCVDTIQNIITIATGGI
jgi:predicted aspartyl protease